MSFNEQKNECKSEFIYETFLTVDSGFTHNVMPWCVCEITVLDEVLGVKLRIGWFFPVIIHYMNHTAAFLQLPFRWPGHYF